MACLIEIFFGEWECVVFHLLPTKNNWLIVCHKHTITGRVRGYVDMGIGKPLYRLERDVILSHIHNYGKSAAN